MDFKKFDFCCNKCRLNVYEIQRNIEVGLPWQAHTILEEKTGTKIECHFQFQQTRHLDLPVGC
jgi:hypothetical protein